LETASPAWSPDGKRIYFAFADGGVSHIGWATPDGDTGIAVDGERACLAFSVATKADRIAFIASDALNPGEVHTATGDGQCERRVTGFNDAWLREVSLSQPECMWFACDDGEAIEGWLMRPPGWSHEGRYPLILQIHGGPHYSLGERFYFDFQRLAALGYLVLYCNPRGSQGYGDQFATCIRGAWGERDALDLMQALDSAAGFVEVDESRLAVTGVSYGGYMTNWLIGHTQRFRAAICENGISNLASNFRTSVHGAEFWTWEMCGTPASEPERYRALSPISYAEQMHTPLLLIHAEQDENCSIAQSEELCDALAALGRSVSLVRIPGEGHLMNLEGRPSARLRRTEVIDGWLARWL
jgi:dipeptidyl aminopeptidase/acylaminoacyl peptidase